MHTRFFSEVPFPIILENRHVIDPGQLAESASVGCFCSVELGCKKTDELIKSKL